MKWMIAIFAALLLAVGAFFFLQAKQGGAGLAADNNLLEQVPADTIFVTQGRMNEDFKEMFERTYIGGSPGQFGMMMAQVKLALQESAHPASNFFKHVLDQYQSQYDGTIASASEFLGLDLYGSAVIYTHGITPVVKVALSDPSKLTKIIDEANKASAMEQKSLKLAGKEVLIWHLDESEEMAAQWVVALLIDNQFATLSLLNLDDSIAVQEERLGLKAPAESLAQSGELDQVIKQNAFNTISSGFFHLQRLAKAATEQDSSRAANELKKLLGMSSSEPMSPACAQDFYQLASAVPRLDFGYTSVNYSDNQLEADFKINWEIANTEVAKDLHTIRGHLAKHTMNTEDNVIGFGLGLNFDTLTPALTGLWTRFTQAQFTCPDLVAYQEQVKATHPMMMGMFIGMLQGIKGVGLSVQDVELADSLMPSSFSGLLTITSENPSAVAALTNMSPMPQLAGIEIPADGTPVILDLPMLPAELEVKAAIKGKHLAIYAGELAAQKAEQLVDEDTSANGVISLSSNYQKLGRIASSAAFSPLANMTGAAQDCAAQLDMANSMATLNGQFFMLADPTLEGWEGRFYTAAEPPTFVEHKPSGDYVVETLNDYCQWQMQGKLSIGADGTATYSESDFAGTCALLEDSLKLDYKNAELSMQQLTRQRRETCGDEFVEETLDKNLQCYMTQVEADQFICQFVSLEAENGPLRMVKAAP